MCKEDWFGALIKVFKKYQHALGTDCIGIIVRDICLLGSLGGAIRKDSVFLFEDWKAQRDQVFKERVIDEAVDLRVIDVVRVEYFGRYGPEKCGNSLVPG